MPDNCGNCAAWIRSDAVNGHCHRRAPEPRILGVSMGIPETTTVVWWPPTSAIDWCYERVPLPVVQVTRQIVPPGDGQPLACGCLKWGANPAAEAYRHHPQCPRALEAVARKESAPDVPAAAAPPAEPGV